MSDSNGSNNRSAMACLLSAATATVTAAAAAAFYIRPHRIHIGESIVGHAVAFPRGDIVHVLNFSRKGQQRCRLCHSFATCCAHNNGSRGAVVVENKCYDTIRYDTTRDAILTCNQKLTRVSLIYRTEPTNKRWGT